LVGIRPAASRLNTLTAWHDTRTSSGVRWQSLFALETPLLEIFVRGSVIYLGLFLMLRLVLKREAGGVSITDLLVIVLIADAAQNGMAGEYRSITDGLVLVAVIIFWSYALDWLGYHVPALNRFVHPQPLPLVKNGQLMRRNMRQELITMDELMTQLREQGVDEVGDVKLASLEGDGRISVVPFETQPGGRKDKPIT